MQRFTFEMVTPNDFHAMQLIGNSIALLGTGESET